MVATPRQRHSIPYMQQQYSTNTSHSHAKQSRDRQITDRSKAQQGLQREKRKKEFH
jgi:hypothetical protein